jgi:threonine aldolase
MAVEDKIYFATDHNDGPHPIVKQYRDRAESGRAPSYGGDKFTREAELRFQSIFGGQSMMRMVAGGGTAANGIAMAAMATRGEGIICADISHMANDERGAIPVFTGGAELLPTVTNADAKLTPDRIRDPELLSRREVVHWSSPKVVSITQPTERGTVYTPDEIRALTEAAHENDMLVHMDGARLFHAAAALGTNDLGSFTTDVGVDVVSIGAAKNGGLGNGEAVVFLNPDLGKKAAGDSKTMGHFPTKSRILASQWLALLENDLGVTLAHQANDAMRHLADLTEDAMQKPTDEIDPSIPMKLSYPIQSNGMWVQFQREQDLAELENDYYFNRQRNPWYFGARREARFMTSYTTTAEEVELFASSINALRAS